MDFARWYVRRILRKEELSKVRNNFAVVENDCNETKIKEAKEKQKKSKLITWI